MHSLISCVNVGVLEAEHAEHAGQQLDLLLIGTKLIRALIALRWRLNPELGIELLKGDGSNERITAWKKDFPHLEEEEDLLRLRVADLSEDAIA